MSQRPGIRYLPCASIRRAPLGGWKVSAEATALIFAPVMTTARFERTDDVPGLMTVTCRMTTSVDWHRAGAASRIASERTASKSARPERKRMRSESTTKPFVRQAVGSRVVRVVLSTRSRTHACWTHRQPAEEFLDLLGNF